MPVFFQKTGNAVFAPKVKGLAS